jgi:hypothetical protein
MPTIDPELIIVIQESVNTIVQQIKVSSAKNWFDYVPILLSSSAPLIAVLFSYIFFSKQHTQSAKAKVAEKDIDRLYEAADLFFEYADSIGLFFSMTEIKSNILNEKKIVPESVNDKTLKATDEVYENFKCIHKAEFLLLSLGETDVAMKVGKYRTETIKFRKEIIELAKWDSSKDYPDNLSHDLSNKIKAQRVKFNSEKNDCLASIAACKLRLKIKD